MKIAIITITLLCFNAAAHAGMCGYPPYPPYGTYPVCVCDANGQNCHWIFVSKK